MRRRVLAVALVVVGSLALLGATWYYTPRVTFAVGDLIYADSTSSLNSLPDVAVGSVLVSSGVGVAPAYSGSLPAAIASPERADGIVFIPAYKGCIADNALLIPARVAANDWALARTAGGAETYNIACSLDLDLSRTTAGKGVKINSLSVVYQITTQNLTTHTWGKVATVTYANGAANTVSAALETPIVLNTAAQANPYVQTATIAAPAYGPAATLVTVNVEWQAVMQNAGVYRVYGVAVNFSRTDL
jgi:hypothetical protein